MNNRLSCNKHLVARNETISIERIEESAANQLKAHVDEESRNEEIVMEVIMTECFH